MRIRDVPQLAEYFGQEGALMLSICCSERESGEAGEKDRLYQDN